MGVVNALTTLLQRATSGVSTLFSIAGAPIARDALALQFGVDRRLTSNVKLGVYRSGLLSSSAATTPSRPSSRRLSGEAGRGRLIYIQKCVSIYLRKVEITSMIVGDGELDR